jgi:hypothetical protein
MSSNQKESRYTPYSAYIYGIQGSFEPADQAGSFFHGIIPDNLLPPQGSAVPVKRAVSMNDHRDFAIRYLRSSPGGPLPFDRENLSREIPLSRPTEESTSESGISYRAYLQAVERFILNNRDSLDTAVCEKSRRPPEAIARVDIVVEKHGSDYHPSRIVAHTGNSVRHYVVNVAVTERGKSRLANEFVLLKRLHDLHAHKFVPKPYFAGEVPLGGSSDCRSMAAMFLAEWFQDFHEFHLSTEASDTSSQMVLWDLDRGYSFLSRTQEQEIYRRAAFIMAYYYNPDTYEEIFPWHQAAGDFVASCCGNTMKVRLTSVRQYAPRVMFEGNDQANRVDALLLFLANLTVRMRLDRLDGVGKIAWAGEHSVSGTMTGFADAMQTKIADGTCDPRLLEEFAQTARSMSPLGWAELFRLVVESYGDESPDVPVIRDHLAEHVYQVYRMAPHHAARCVRS